MGKKRSRHPEGGWIGRYLPGGRPHYSLWGSAWSGLTFLRELSGQSPMTLKTGPGSGPTLALHPPLPRPASRNCISSPPGASPFRTSEYVVLCCHRFFVMLLSLSLSPSPGGLFKFSIRFPASMTACVHSSIVGGFLLLPSCLYNVASTPVACRFLRTALRSDLETGWRCLSHERDHSPWMTDDDNGDLDGGDGRRRRFFLTNGSSCPWLLTGLRRRDAPSWSPAPLIECVAFFYVSIPRELTSRKRPARGPCSRARKEMPSKTELTFTCCAQ